MSPTINSWHMDTRRFLRTWLPRPRYICFRQPLPSSSSLLRHPWLALVLDLTSFFSWEIRSNLNGVPFSFYISASFFTYSCYLPSCSCSGRRVVPSRKSPPAPLGSPDPCPLIAVLPSLVHIVFLPLFWMGLIRSSLSDLKYHPPWPNLHSSFHPISFLLFTAKKISKK